MTSTSEHISIRIPAETMEALRREALELERSVSWVIVRKLSGRGVEGHAQGKPIGVHSLSQPSIGTGLADAQQVSSPAAPTNPQGRPAEDFTAMARDREKSVPESKSCPNCGALSGHQKWCKHG